MFKQWLIAATLLGATALVQAHDYTMGTLTIEHPWARATVAGAVNSAVFMNIKTETDDQLLSVSGDIAQTIEIHEMKMADGTMKMRQLTRLDLSKGSETRLAPGGNHIMLFGLKRQLLEGEKFPLTLKFAKAGELKVDVKVESQMYKPSGHQGHKGH
ncbi:copper chaperone PCu(A)C [Chitinibacter sp. S2-10]|uniref:copper chaperone PCu(A)C n=1 Tax=Chitinibacter sp. S2-10 TaxID=3373597 RepID=UPI0039775888